MKGISIFQHHTQPQLLVEEGYFSLFLLTAGQLKIQQQGKEIVVRTGDLVVSTPASMQQITETNEPCQVTGIKYTVDYLKEIKTLNDVHKTFAYFEYQYLPIWSLSEAEEDLLLALIQKLQQRKEAIGQHLFAIPLFNLTFTEMVMELIQIGSKQDKTFFQHYNRAEYLTMQFMILARDSYKEQTKLLYYASKLTVSVKYLSETLKRMTGKTAKEILMELRLGQAKLLLATTSLDISQIAYELSYDSVSSFSRSFKQIEGLSPKEYRDLQL